MWLKHGATPSFLEFRNSSNQVVATINTNGDINVTGSIKVNGVQVGATGPAGPTGPSPVLTIQEKTSSYTIQSSDKDSLIYVNSPLSASITVDSNSLANIGDQVTVVRYGTGTCNFVAGTATLVSTPGLTLRAQYSAATLIKITSTNYLVSGDTTV